MCIFTFDFQSILAPVKSLLSCHFYTTGIDVGHQLLYIMLNDTRFYILHSIFRLHTGAKEVIWPTRVYTYLGTEMH